MEIYWNVTYIEYICLFEKTDERVYLNFICKYINVFVSKQWEIVKGHQSQLTQNSQPRRQKQSTHAKRAGTMHNSFNWNWNFSFLNFFLTKNIHVVLIVPLDATFDAAGWRLGISWHAHCTNLEQRKMNGSWIKSWLISDAFSEVKDYIWFGQAQATEDMPSW